jgi:hypothetical protein
MPIFLVFLLSVGSVKAVKKLKIFSPNFYQSTTALILPFCGLQCLSNYLPLFRVENPRANE